MKNKLSAICILFIFWVLLIFFYVSISTEKIKEDNINCDYFNGSEIEYHKINIKKIKYKLNKENKFLVILVCEENND